MLRPQAFRFQMVAPEPGVTHPPLPAGVLELMGPPGFNIPYRCLGGNRAELHPSPTGMLAPRRANARDQGEGSLGFLWGGRREAG